MNKFQQSLDYIESILLDEDVLRIFDSPNYPPLIKHHIKKIQELVEKATPKKPTKYKAIHHSIEDIILYKCQCGCCLSYAYNFCPKCGQAIKWGDEDDR